MIALSRTRVDLSEEGFCNQLELLELLLNVKHFQWTYDQSHL
jgi:hypothetical protein